MNLTTAFVLFFVAILLPVFCFECPAPRRRKKNGSTRNRSKATFHRHETHCDKYYVCSAGRDKVLVSREKTCPDGMVFNYKYVNFGRRCVLPPESDCGGLTEFQPPQPNGPCKRQNGYFVLEDDRTCRKYVQCTTGTPTSLECPTGTAFAVANANCDWPDNVKSCNLTELYGFKCPDNFALFALRHGPNVKFPDPNDCRSFFTCGANKKPRKLGCQLGRVFNDKSQMCDEPDNVSGCESYYKSSSEEDYESQYYSDDQDGDDQSEDESHETEEE